MSDISAGARMQDLAASDVHDATPEEAAEALGQAHPRPTGQQMFDEMTEAEQDEAFGPVVAAALRAGDIALADLVAKQPLASERDFIRPASHTDLGLNEEEPS